MVPGNGQGPHSASPSWDLVSPQVPACVGCVRRAFAGITRSAGFDRWAVQAERVPWYCQPLSGVCVCQNRETPKCVVSLVFIWLPFKPEGTLKNTPTEATCLFALFASRFTDGKDSRQRQPAKTTISSIGRNMIAINCFVWM